MSGVALRTHACLVGAIYPDDKDPDGTAAHNHHHPDDPHKGHDMFTGGP